MAVPFYHDGRGNFHPLVFKDYEVSDDKRIWTVYMRRGMKWSDGHPFTADDVLFYVDDLLANEEFYPNAPARYVVDSQIMTAEKVDDHTVTLKFTAPYGTFLTELATPLAQEPVLWAKHYCQQFHPKFNPDVQAMVDATEAVCRAAARAGVDLAEIDHFVFNTPLAWYARFCARVLGADPSRTLSVYPLYANVGPALLGLNLLHAAHWREFRPGDLVLLYTVGSVSSCSASVLRARTKPSRAICSSCFLYSPFLPRT